MRILLQLAAAFLVLGAATTTAQITNPDDLVAPPPTNPARHQPLHADDNLQWLWTFTRPAPNGRADDLRVDGRFQAMLSRDFRQPQSMWGPEGSNEPLPTVIPLFLSAHGVVTAKDNRYISVDGCVPSFCAAHGLLWFDLASPQPLTVFAAVNWIAENHTTDQAAADYNLWLFPNRSLNPDALPLGLTEALADWDARLAAAHRLVPHIAQALLVEPGGQPYALDPSLAGANTIAAQPATD